MQILKEFSLVSSTDVSSSRLNLERAEDSILGYAELEEKKKVKALLSTYKEQHDSDNEQGGLIISIFDICIT